MGGPVDPNMITGQVARRGNRLVNGGGQGLRIVVVCAIDNAGIVQTNGLIDFLPMIPKLSKSGFQVRRRYSLVTLKNFFVGNAALPACNHSPYVDVGVANAGLQANVAGTEVIQLAVLGMVCRVIGYPTKESIIPRIRSALSRGLD